MRWEEEGLVLHAARHGEHGAVLHLLTHHHGRHAGMVRSLRKQAALCQPGTLVHATWQARLSEQLGHYTLEMHQPLGAALLPHTLPLLLMQSVCALLMHTLPERESMAALYLTTTRYVTDLRDQVRQPGQVLLQHYVRFELELLAHLGYGLALDLCADTGTTKDLCYVSPRSGRAVCRTSGAPYADKLLPLPPFLGASPPQVIPDFGEIIDGLRLTGYFLSQHVHVAASLPPMPAARNRIEAYAQQRNVPHKKQPA